MSPRLANWLLLFAGAIWGLGFIAQKTAMDDMDPMLFIGLRFGLAGIAVLPLVKFERGRKSERLTRTSLGWFSLLGAVFFTGMALQQTGLQGTTVTNAGFLTTTYVVLVPLILYFVLKQSQPVWIWPAAAASLLGVYLLSFGSVSRFAWGDAWILAGALVWAIHVILVGIVSRGTTLPITMACIQFLVCGALALAGYTCLAATGNTTHPLSADSLWAALPEVVYAGVVSGGIAFTLQAVAQRYTSASVAAILMASESLFAALLGAVMLAERLSPPGYLGCLLIFAAIVLVESKQRKDNADKRN